MFFRSFQIFKDVESVASDFVLVGVNSIMSTETLAMTQTNMCIPSVNVKSQVIRLFTKKVQRFNLLLRY